MSLNHLKQVILTFHQQFVKHSYYHSIFYIHRTNILKSNLLNQYYVYAEIGSVPKNIKETWYDMFESYTEPGGNSFIKHDIEPKCAKLSTKN